MGCFVIEAKILVFLESLVHTKHMGIHSLLVEGNLAIILIKLSTECGSSMFGYARSLIVFHCWAELLACLNRWLIYWLSMVHHNKVSCCSLSLSLRGFMLPTMLFLGCFILSSLSRRIS